MLRYSSTVNAMNSNKLGRNSNGPSPYALNPNGDEIKGLDVTFCTRNTKVKITSPTVNGERVFMYIFT